MFSSYGGFPSPIGEGCRGEVTEDSSPTLSPTGGEEKRFSDECFPSPRRGGVGGGVSRTRLRQVFFKCPAEYVTS